MSRALAVSLIGGLLGGLLGAGVMSVGHTLASRLLPAAPAEPGEDATVKVGQSLSRAVRGRPLAEDEKPTAGTLVHYGFGAALGATYGVVAALVPAAAAAYGAAFGVAAYLGPHAIVVPALGLAPSPLRRPPAQEALELVLHVLYGLTVEAVRRLFH
jgi:uncharacterized membrane protein YagU involved in acid resistance